MKQEPISSIDLMERASGQFVEALSSRLASDCRISVFCGVGNNGGDGLVVARLLVDRGYTVNTYGLGQINQATDDFQINYQRLEGEVVWLSDENQFPDPERNEIVIDAIFGVGLTRPITGLAQSLIRHLNQSAGIRVALDIASGLYADREPSSEEVVFEPSLTISFQTPKWSFFQPQCSRFVGRFIICSIGLDLSFLEAIDLKFRYTEQQDFYGMDLKRQVFSHKGSFGRLQLVAGSRGKMGAAVLSAKSSLRAGAGLLTVCVPACGLDILQTTVPEAMVSICSGIDLLDDMPLFHSTDVIAIGPGLGTDAKTAKAFKELLASLSTQKFLIDADAINMLSAELELLRLLPEGSILTPHPKEFERLVGPWHSDNEKLKLLQDFCVGYGLNVVLKGAYSAVCSPTGVISFNSTGNPGMATAGSGDVLLGIIAGLLSSGLSSEHALKYGVYIHGLAGDIAAEQLGERSLIAGDIIEYLPAAFQIMNKRQK
ncbi:MAG: NAD(P)H-hydrate epimerase [Cyclobacteriaceae bacterium]|jgi:NAD(P)H-hydrate epimerase